VEEIFGGILEVILELLLSLIQNKKIHIVIRMLIIGAIFLPFIALFTFISMKSFESEKAVPGVICVLVCVVIALGMAFLGKKAICAK